MFLQIRLYPTTLSGKLGQTVGKHIDTKANRIWKYYNLEVCTTIIYTNQKFKENVLKFSVVILTAPLTRARAELQQYQLRITISCVYFSTAK